MRQFGVAAAALAVGVHVAAGGGVLSFRLAPAAPAAAGPTAPGSAFAATALLNVNPQYGGLSIGVRGAQSTASYTATSAVADSTAVNTGFLGASLAGGGENGCTNQNSAAGSPALAGIEATSAADPHSATADGGLEMASATASPETATATTDLSPVTIPGLLTVSGESTSTVAYVADKAQQAGADAILDVSLLGGLVDLRGLDWNATQQTGTTPTSSATFRAGSVAILGKTTTISSPAQLTSLIPQINALIGPQGLTVVAPTTSHDPVTGAIAIGPLRLELTGNTITNTVLGSLNTEQAALEKEIGAAIASTGNACLAYLSGDVGVAELIAGIVEGIMAGGGVIDMDLGGASADTEAAPNYVNPLAGFGEGGGGVVSSGAVAPAQSGPSTTTVTVPGSPGSPGSSASSGATTAVAPPASSSIGTDLVDAPAAVFRCVTTSPADRPSCWSGAAPLTAGALLVIGGGLFAADAVRSRRRSNRPKETL